MTDSTSATLTFLLLAFFAFWVTVHVATLFGLAKSQPRWHAPLALFVPPVGPYFAFRKGMRLRAVLWVLGALGYGTLLILAR